MSRSGAQLDDERRTPVLVESRALQQLAGDHEPGRQTGERERDRRHLGLGELAARGESALHRRIGRRRCHRDSHQSPDPAGEQGQQLLEATLSQTRRIRKLYYRSRWV
jgi:hypothetical protein